MRAGGNSQKFESTGCGGGYQGVRLVRVQKKKMVVNEKK